jgi:Heat induced stress protein YflT domain
MAEHNAVVGVYNAHTEAEAAVKELQRSGFDMQKLSIVGKDYQTGNRSASENLTLATASFYGVLCRYGNTGGLTTRHLGPDTP